MQLKEITAGLSLAGVEPTQVVSVVATVPLGDGALQLIYRTPDGGMKERLLGSADEASISVATVERPFSFDGDGAAFQLACEAKRIDLAFLFDPMMAVHTSNVEALPHQITAVYESMLPRQPLRFVLADDPGAGKTIMAGLYIRELIMRADARRILIVAPGSLVEQWRDELFEKFGLEFRIYSTFLEQASPSGNPFDSHHQLIVRLDQLSRNEDLQEKLCAAGWDLAVFDEAHKLAAHYFGSKLEKTGRFRFAEKVGAHVRHLLLMTATPHSGKEEDYQLFLSLLDADRFYGKFRDGVHKVDASDLMRRMVKEELVRFDGTPLFPERKAYTVNYTLSDLEATLYESVTRYVQTEMGKADELQGPRKGSVGFALTALQRRLASSPEAIYQSLKRRKERLENRLRDEKLGVRGRHALAETLADVPEDDDDLNAEEQENLEETLVDEAMEDRKRRFDDKTDVRGKIAEALKQGAGNATFFDGVHILTPHGDVPDDGALRLVVLPPERWYSREESRLAFDAALDCMQNNGPKPRHRWNRLLFLAADYDTLSRLNDAARVALAWASIVDDIQQDRLTIDNLQRKQAEKELQTAEEVLPRAARECYRWLICPVQETPTDHKPAVEAFAINTTGGSVGREIERVCVENELVIITWSPIHLRTKLTDLYWKESRPTAGAMAFWEDTLRYLYLPRLKDRDVLAKAIRSGATSRDFFGTAYGQHDGIFEGFQLGSESVQLDDTLLLIEPAAAKQYEAAHSKPEGTLLGISGVEGVPSEQGTGGTATIGPEKVPGEGAGPARARSFHGTVDVAPATAKMRMVQIAEEIVSLLVSDPNASVKVVVEISAEFPNGAKDQLKRAVSENSQSLGLKSADWE